MAMRVQEHLNKHTKGNPNIPVAVRNNTVKSDDVEADVVAIFVGKKDSEAVFKTLKNHPFPDCEIVLKSMKRGNPEEWTKRIKIHAQLSEGSRAVKICLATDEFRNKLVEKVVATPSIYGKIIDIARVGFEGEEMSKTQYPYGLRGKLNRFTQQKMVGRTFLRLKRTVKEQRRQKGIGAKIKCRKRLRRQSLDSF